MHRNTRKLSAVFCSILALYPLRSSATPLEVIASADEIAAANSDGSIFIDFVVSPSGSTAYPQINERGEIVFGASTWNGDPLAGPDVRLYSISGNRSISEIVRDGSQIDGDAQLALRDSFALGFTPQIGAGGAASLTCRLEGPGVDESNDMAVLRVASGEMSLPLRAGTMLPELPSPNNVTSIAAAVLASSGDTIARVQLGSSSSIIRIGSEGAVAIARAGQSAPGAAQASFHDFANGLQSLLAVNARGDVVFPAQIAGAGVTPATAAGIWKYRSGLSLVARDGTAPSNDDPACGISGAAYARVQLNASGAVAFDGMRSCSGVRAIYSDRSGALHTEAYVGSEMEGPSGSFRIGSILPLATSLHPSSDAGRQYHRAFLADNGDLYLLAAPLTHAGKNSGLRSRWGIIRLPHELPGYGDIIVESSSTYSSLGVELDYAAPLPEQISFASDGTLLLRSKLRAAPDVGPHNDDILISWSSARGTRVIREGSEIEGYRLQDLSGAVHLNGAALTRGRAFADARVTALGDETPRSAIIGIGENGLPRPLIVSGNSLAQHGGNSRLVRGFESPFYFKLRRNVMNDRGDVVFSGLIENSNGVQHAVLRASLASEAVCPADFDGSGSVETADIFAFLSAFYAGDLAADIDGSGVIAVPDIFAFLSLFFAGCH